MNGLHLFVPLKDAELIAVNGGSSGLSAIANAIGIGVGPGGAITNLSDGIGEGLSGLSDGTGGSLTSLSDGIGGGFISLTNHF